MTSIAISIATHHVPNRTARGQNTPTVAITSVRSPDRVATEPVQFSADLMGVVLPFAPSGSVIWDPAFHRYVYRWTFPDEGKTSYNAPQKLLAQWSDPRVKYGKNVGHVFETPGEKTVVLDVFDQSGAPVASATWNTTADSTGPVLDPEAYYTGPNVILVNTAGASDPAYPGANVRTALVDAINLQKSAALRDTPCIIRLKRGETHDIADGTSIVFNGTMANVHIDAYGTEDDPVVRDLGTSGIAVETKASLTASMVRLCNVKIEGQWNAVTETGNARNIFLTASCPHLFHNSEIAGFSVVQPWTGIGALFLSETKMTDWQLFGALGLVENGLYVLGADIGQNPDANAGGGSTTENNRAGPLRASGGGIVYITGTSMFSASGWFNNTDYRTVQPCIRFTEWAENSYIHLVGNTYEGKLNFTPTDPGKENRACNIILEDFYQVVHSSAPYNVIEINHPGMTIRNGQTIRQAGPNHHLAEFRAPIVVSNSRANAVTPSFDDEPVEIYNYTFVDLNDDSVASHDLSLGLVDDQSGVGEFNNLMVENTIAHQPNKTAAHVPDAPLATYGIGHNSRFKGYKYKAGALVDQTLRDAIDANQTTGIVVDREFAQRLSAEGAVGIVIGSEEITFTGTTRNSGQWELTGVTRGANGTTAAAHSAGATVENAAIPLLMQFAAPTDNWRLYAPDISSVAAGSGNTGLVWPLDMRRTFRSSNNFDRGAVQVTGVTPPPDVAL